jgi:GLPGLI family protein
MNKIRRFCAAFSILIGCCATIFGQQKKCHFSAIYKFSYAIDSSKTTYRSDEYALLKTAENTYFYNDALNFNDSLLRQRGYNPDASLSSDEGKRLLKAVSSREFFRGTKKPGSDLVAFYNNGDKKQYIRYRNISIPMYYSCVVSVPVWNIKSDETDIMMGVPVIKATTNYGGREYIAWFAPTIPIKEGPYVFKNLPGLILKVYDIDRNFEFQLLKFDNKEKLVSIEKGIDGVHKDIEYNEWVKVRHESYYNPDMKFVSIENRAANKCKNLENRYFLIEI